MASLIRSNGRRIDNDMLADLAEYFAKMIFNLVDKPIDEEIPLKLVKEVNASIILENYFWWEGIRVS